MSKQEPPQNRDGRAIARAKIDAIVEKIIALPGPIVRNEAGHVCYFLDAALKALDIATHEDDDPFHDEEHQLHEFAHNADLFVFEDHGVDCPMVSLPEILGLLTPLSRTPEAIEYQRWLRSGVAFALLHHGHYDPQTGHNPPPGEELDALERRERYRDETNAIFPGLGDAIASRDPSTPD